MSAPLKLTQRSRVVSDKKMTLMERIYLPAILKGMSITPRHFFRPKTVSLRTREGRPYGKP